MPLLPTTISTFTVNNHSAQRLYTNPELSPSLMNQWALSNFQLTAVYTWQTSLMSSAFSVFGVRKTSTCSHRMIPSVMWTDSQEWSLSCRKGSLCFSKLHYMFTHWRFLENLLWQWHVSYWDRKHTTPQCRSCDNILLILLFLSVRNSQFK